MIQTTVEVGGMACSMCESHINDTVRNAFPVEKVSSSHALGDLKVDVLQNVQVSEVFVNVFQLDHYAFPFSSYSLPPEPPCPAGCKKGAW